MRVDFARLQINKPVLRLFSKLFSDTKLSRNFVQTLLKDIVEVNRDRVVDVKSIFIEELENMVAQYESVMLSPL